MRNDRAGIPFDLLGVGISIAFFGRDDESGALADLHRAKGVIDALDHAARTNAHGKRLIQVLVDVTLAEDAPLIANVGNLADSVLFHMLPFQTIEGLSPSLHLRRI